MEMREFHQETVPLMGRIWVSAGDAASALMNNFVTGVGLSYYFTSWRGMDPGLAATVWLIFAIWNSVNDPLFGYISDRTKSRLGRRVPYIRYGAPIFGASFIACWMDWGGGGSQASLFIQMLLLLFIFDSLYTAIATSLYVMPFEMAISNRARSSIFVWKMLFAIFPMAVPLLLFNAIKPNPGDDAINFRWVTSLLGLGMGLIIFLSTYFYQEKHFQQDQDQPTFINAIKECFNNKSFIIFEVISFTVIYAQTALMLGLGYYLDEIGLPPIPLYTALMFGIVPGILAFVRLREKLGIKSCVRIMALIFAAGCFILLGLGKYLAPAIIGFFFFGVGFAGAMYLIPLMNGDVVDMDEFRTGLRREGMYAGVNSFITKPAISLANSVFLWFLSIYGYNFSLPKGAQPPTAETGILMGWTLVCGLLLVMSFIALHWYPLSGDHWDKIKNDLAGSHADKEKKFLESHGLK